MAVAPGGEAGMTVPFMQLYVADYLADTLDLTCEEHGAYLLLLMTMWRHGAKLPSDPQKLCRIVRLSPKKWAAVWPQIERFFIVEGDQISNPRLTAEFQKAEGKSEKRSAAGERGGKAKALKDKERALANAMPMSQHLLQISESEKKKETEPNGSGKKKASPRSRLPDGWKLPRDWGVWAVEKGLSDPAIRHEAEAFANYHRAKGSLMADWQAAWRTWVNNQIKFAAERQKPKIGGDDFWAGRALT
jgi:uncharacterized protein YdaU (DUF1376 family)